MKSDKRPQGGPAVQNGDALFGSLFSQTAVGVAVISPEGGFVRAHEALCRMLGYDEQELLQKTVRDVAHADDLESTQEIRLEFLAGPGARVHERRYLRKDGSALWVQVAGALVRDGSGSPQCFVALVYDITELKLAQDALKASESRLRRMVELSSDWYWVQDENSGSSSCPEWKSGASTRKPSLAMRVGSFRVPGRFRKRPGSSTAKSWSATSRSAISYTRLWTTRAKCAI